MSEIEAPSLFGGYFNLHPSDAYSQVLQCTNFLSTFTDAFKERIQSQIDYSRSLLKTSKLLDRFITPADPSPVSFIASAFQVEHEERARHALELAQYLHSEVEVPCTTQLRQAEADLKKLEKELRAFYKEGETVEEAYQKHLKKYYRTRQEWEQMMISKSVLSYTPGATPSQKEKAAIKSINYHADWRNNVDKTNSLQSFNNFATRYNAAIRPILSKLQSIEIDGLALQTDSLRKLIVSEINMFKNIEYDLLNISRQMEAVVPGSQIEDFVVSNKDQFKSPIISIYAEGPIASRYHLSYPGTHLGLQTRYDAIDIKTPICGSLLEESLIRIDSGVFYWLLDNKTNSTLRYAIEQLMLRHEGGQYAKQQGEGELLNELQVTISSNKSVKQLPIDNKVKSFPQYLKMQQIYSCCLQLTTAITHLLKNQSQQRRDALFQMVQGHLSCHHLYRFIAYASLNAHQEQHEQRVSGQNYPLLLKLLLQRSLAVKDVFVARLTLALLFSVAYLSQRPLFCYQFQAIRGLQCWQSRDFWQACIFQSTFQVSTLLPSIERSYLKDVYLMRQKNVVFSALVTYCHYMVMMGEEVQQVKEVMGKFAHIYNLTEEHQRDLGKSIASSIKQLKEMQGTQ